MRYVQHNSRKADRRRSRIFTSRQLRTHYQELEPRLMLAADFLEDNDTFATATYVGSGDYSVDNLTIDAAFDDDYFKVVAGSSGTLTATVSFLHAQGDVDLFLYDSTQTQIDASTSSSNSEQVSASVTAGSTYYIKVVGYNGQISPDYDLAIDGPDIAPDYLEENDTMGNATYLGSGDVSYLGLTIDASGDGDWYEWIASDNGTLTVDVNFIHGLNNDVDFEILDSGGSYLTGSFSTTNNEHASTGVTAGSSYFIHVYGYSNSVHHNYALEIDGPDTALPDYFEDNDTMGTATYLGSGDQSHFGLTIDAAGDDDWYAVYAAADGILTVDALFLHGQRNDVDLYLFNSGGIQLDYSASSTDNEQVSSAVTAGNTYFIQVHGFGGSIHHDYDLVINGPDIAPDYLEENDTMGNATYLGSGDISYYGLTIDAPGDGDWYEWIASNNGTLTVDVNFIHAENNDVDFEILDSGGSYVTGSFSTNNNEHASTGVTAGSSYFIHVYGYSDSVHHDYALLVDGPNTAPVDFLEQNDTMGTAVDLGGGDQSYSGLTIDSPGDDDWYKWYAASSGIVTVDALFRYGQDNDIDLQLYDAGGNILSGSYSVTDNEQVSSAVTAGNDYFIRVYGFGGSIHHDYDLVINFEFLQGDGNGDGWVDGLDYLIWAGNYATHPGPDGDISDGDYNDDGWVDGLDYLMWAGNYGNHAAEFASQTASAGNEVKAVDAVVEMDYDDSSIATTPPTIRNWQLSRAFDAALESILGKSQDHV
ncbi:MAG: pre-peptidase C-terminal domain-containing protein [Pirellulales bacterium]